MRTRIVASATAASVLLMNVAAGGQPPTEDCRIAKQAPVMVADVANNMKRPLLADVTNSLKRPLIAVA